eukprot:1179362-Prorocentrum_minimum.AAC.4
MAQELIGEEKCVGFAKLKGKDFELYLTKYTITLGRRSKSSNVDIALGDNMNLSRHHASIIYNFERGAWELVVHGKNGVTADEKFIAPGHDPHKLSSKERLQVCIAHLKTLDVVLASHRASTPPPSGAEPLAKKASRDLKHDREWLFAQSSSWFRENPNKGPFCPVSKRKLGIIIYGRLFKPFNTLLNLVGAESEQQEGTRYFCRKPACPGPFVQSRHCKVNK